jgi:hypothetical protein
MPNLSRVSDMIRQDDIDGLTAEERMSSAKKKLSFDDSSLSYNSYNKDSLHENSVGAISPGVGEKNTPVASGPEEPSTPTSAVIEEERKEDRSVNFHSCFVVGSSEDQYQLSPEITEYLASNYVFVVCPIAKKYLLEKSPCYFF